MLLPLIYPIDHFLGNTLTDQDSSATSFVFMGMQDGIDRLVLMLPQEFHVNKAFMGEHRRTTPVQLKPKPKQIGFVQQRFEQ
jgi:hypothetical protein